MSLDAPPLPTIVRPGRQLRDWSHGPRDARTV